MRPGRPVGSTAPPAAFYLYSPDRKAAHAKELLNPCRGFLHADGYAGFSDLYLPDPKTNAPRLVEVARMRAAKSTRCIWKRSLRRRPKRST